MKLGILGVFCFGFLALSSAQATTTNINFEDVSSGGVALTSRYLDLGVTFHAISNPFPLLGSYPSPDTLPATLGDVVSADLPSYPDLGWVAAADRQFFTPTETTLVGENGILISFGFDVSHVALQGVDGGYGFPSPLRDEDESVTLTAYDSTGRKLGFVYSTLNLSGSYDVTPASIDFPNIRHVAFNYTGNGYGFYALDNLSFISAVPEPNISLLLLAGLGLITAKRRILGA